MLAFRAEIFQKDEANNLQTWEFSANLENFTDDDKSANKAIPWLQRFEDDWVTEW